MTISRRHKRGLLAALTFAAATLILLAAGLSQLELLPGRPFPMESILQIIRAWSRPILNLSLPAGLLGILALVTWLLFFMFIIAFIFWPDFRKEALKRGLKYFVLLLIIFWLVQNIHKLPFLKLQEVDGASLAPAETHIPVEGLPTPPKFVVDPPPWFVFIISAGLIALLLGVIWFVWQRFQSQESPTTANALELLTEEAQQALAELQAGHNLKDTVMRCYVEMSQILGKQRGLRRQQTMTPREFEQYLAESGLSSEHIGRLTRLFERVRYGAKLPGYPEEQEAVACLSAIVQAYGQAS